MIKKSKTILTAVGLLMSSLMLLNCESEPDGTGKQFFDNDTAKGEYVKYDLIAYHISNMDTIKADGRINNLERKDTVVIGAFNDSQFGMQKASFVSQLRMEQFGKDFGENPKIDSVVLVLKPKYYFAFDSVKTRTEDSYVWPADQSPAKRVTKFYPVYKYGKAKIGGAPSKLTINVNEVNDFIGSSNEIIYSNKKVSEGQLLGSKTFDGRATSVEVTKNSDQKAVLSLMPSIRIPLNKDFFKTKILDKQGKPELSDYANFIRYFKGIKISVAENDGYLMKLNVHKITSEPDIIVYYQHDKTGEGKTTRESDVINFSLADANASYSQIEYNRAGAPIQNILAISNKNTGDAKLYVQGMGGPNIGLQIPEATLAQLKDEYKKNNIGIISAKLRLYTDATLWNSKLAKPSYFTVMQELTSDNGRPLYQFLSDMTAFSTARGYSFFTSHNLKFNPAYYDISITQTLINMIEKDAKKYPNKPFILKLGKYLSDSNNRNLGQNVDSRVYAPERVILVGTEANNDKRAQLIVTYGKK